MNTINPFHIAIPVHNIEACREFYRDTLNCEEGRSTSQWVDFNFFGHQLVIHLKLQSNNKAHANPIDGKHVPIPHYGVVLNWDVFENLAQDLKQKNIRFIIEPYIRFEGQIGEQTTMFIQDPSGNAIEFKAFKDMNQLFAK